MEKLLLMEVRHNTTQEWRDKTEVTLMAHKYLMQGKLLPKVNNYMSTIQMKIFYFQTISFFFCNLYTDTPQFQNDDLWRIMY
jgi:hypothetical protein